jgi:hypothetical protein
MKILHIAITSLALACAGIISAQAADVPDKPAAPAKAAGKQRTFATPEDAAAALADAVRAKDVNALVAIVGPGSGAWLFSGDKVADANDWRRFLSAYEATHKLQDQADGSKVLSVGDDDWPFPAPIAKHGERWAFDPKAGHEELLNRRIGRNELDAIQTLLAIVDAQREYARMDPDHSGSPDYARRFLSSPGKKDGLYWPEQPGGEQSPLGPMVAVAASEGYGKQQRKAGERAPYHGYYFKILTAQGPDAPGGAYDYLVGDRLMGGFAVVAWPASYGVSGIMTFLVNHEGVVFEKDLGSHTASIAAALTRFNPDTTWRKAQ